jgi:hypothetical protein
MKLCLYALVAAVALIVIAPAASGIASADLPPPEQPGPYKGCGNDSIFQQPYDITEGITSRQMAIAPVLMPILRLSKTTVFEK